MSKTGIITALRAEAACLSPKSLQPAIPLTLTENLLLVLSGMGEDRVNSAIDALLKQKVDALVSFGTAAALHPDLKSGDIIIAENVVTSAGERQNISGPWHDTVIQQLQPSPGRVSGGDIVMTEKVIIRTEDKHALYLQTGAVAVDMESGFILKAAQQNKLAALVIRIIVDAADTILPEQVLETTDAYGEVLPGRLAHAILRRPLLIANLISLGLSFRKAKRTMQWIGRHPWLLHLPD